MVVVLFWHQTESIAHYTCRIWTQSCPGSRAVSAPLSMAKGTRLGACVTSQVTLEGGDRWELEPRQVSGSPASWAFSPVKKSLHYASLYFQKPTSSWEHQEGGRSRLVSLRLELLQERCGATLVQPFWLRLSVWQDTSYALRGVFILSPLFWSLLSLGFCLHGTRNFNIKTWEHWAAQGMLRGHLGHRIRPSTDLGPLSKGLSALWMQ